MTTLLEIVCKKGIGYEDKTRELKGFLGVGLGVGGALIPSMTIILCALAVSALVAGIAVGLAIYFLSQDYKQAKSIEEAVNPQLSFVEHEKAYTNEAMLKNQ